MLVKQQHQPRTWVDGDRAFATLHVHHPSGRFPSWSVLHVEGKHSAHLLDQLLSFLRETRSFTVTNQFAPPKAAEANHVNEPEEEEEQGGTWIMEDRGEKNKQTKKRGREINRLVCVEHNKKDGRHASFMHVVPPLGPISAPWCWLEPGILH